MGARHTVAIRRSELTRECLYDVRLWPGCETIEIGILGDLRGGFSIHVTDYGTVKPKIADRAVRCVQREKLRHYHLVID